MRQMTINFHGLEERADAQEYLAGLFDDIPYYGKNLDALHDVLTSLGETELTLEYPQDADGYGKRVLRVVKDAAKENPLLKLL